MIRFFSGISIWYQVAIIGVILAAAVGSAWLIHDHIWSSGYDQAVTDIAAKTAKAKAEAATNVEKVEKRHEKNIKRIQDMPDNTFGDGPITSSVLDGLR